ncbi:unnamed protein product [Cuscuta epithymum]|uniref:Uncharacterized protein n=1 Tax=Cuscuta epithymum TaxID=186058 RepID=A0AAV0FFU1_9ASTE|nr:unnamed protein product [Cuscuta epithymum]
MKTSKIYFILWFIIMIGNIRVSIEIDDEEDPGILDYVQSLPKCSNKQPPCSECRKHVLALIQQDGDHTTTKTPSRMCCSQFIEWGYDCYCVWVSSDDHADYMDFGDSMAVLDNIRNVWNRCKSDVLMTENLPNRL